MFCKTHRKLVDQRILVILKFPIKNAFSIVGGSWLCGYAGNFENFIFPTYYYRLPFFGPLKMTLEKTTKKQRNFSDFAFSLKKN